MKRLAVSFRGRNTFVANLDSSSVLLKYSHVRASKAMVRPLNRSIIIVLVMFAVPQLWLDLCKNRMFSFSLWQSRYWLYDNCLLSHLAKVAECFKKANAISSSVKNNLSKNQPHEKGRAL